MTKIKNITIQISPMDNGGWVVGGKCDYTCSNDKESEQHDHNPMIMFVQMNQPAILSKEPFVCYAKTPEEVGQIICNEINALGIEFKQT